MPEKTDENGGRAIVVSLARAAAGEWPTNASDLPLFLTQQQLAHLLGKSVRTLERHRHVGQSIPFKKVGRTVL